MDIMSVVKEHPIPIGIGVVVILLIVFSKGGSGASSNNAGTFLQAQSIAAGSNAQIAEITMHGNIAQGQQSVERNSIAEGAATERASIVAGLFATMVGTGAQVRMNSDNNAIKSQMNLAAQTQSLNQTMVQQAIARETIAAGVKTSGDKLAAQITMQENDNNFKLNAIGLETGGNLALMAKRGDLDAKAMDKQLDFQGKLISANAATLPMILQHQQTMQKASGDLQYQLASIATAADRRIADAKARNIDADTGGDWISNIAKIIAFF